MIEFKLPDMSCGHCVSRVTQALKGADPACSVEVDLASKTAKVHSDEPRELLAETLTEAGYPPQ